MILIVAFFLAIPKEANGEVYTDFTGTDLQYFLVYTLQNNARERVHLLKIEQDLINLIKDEERQSHKFPPMSSYHRMFVHRVAAFFGLEHNIDEAGSSVIVIKQKGVTRIPDIRFRDHIKSVTHSLDEPKKLILKRDTASFDDFKQPMDRRANSLSNYADLRKCKSFEEREEQYVKIRARIFNQKTGLEEPAESSQDAASTPARDLDTSSPFISETNEVNDTATDADPQPSSSNNESISAEIKGDDLNELEKSGDIEEDAKESADTKKKATRTPEVTSKCSVQSNCPKTDEPITSHASFSDYRQSSSNDRYRSANGSYKKPHPKLSHSGDNQVSSVSSSTSIMPYSNDVNNQLRAYAPPFPYVDYGHPWFTTLPPMAPAPETIPGNNATAFYGPTTPYIATNLDFYAGQLGKPMIKCTFQIHFFLYNRFKLISFANHSHLHFFFAADNRADKCKNQAYVSPATGAYFPYFSPEMQINVKTTSATNGSGYSLPAQMASMCLSANPTNPSSSNGSAAPSQAAATGGYVMPDQIGSSAIPFYYLPTAYPTTITPNGNAMPAELMYSNMLGYHHHHHHHHAHPAHHHHLPQIMGTTPSAQIIMIPGIGSNATAAASATVSSMNSFGGFKPMLTGASSSSASTIPIDSYVKFNPYATFQSMQANTSHSAITSLRSPVS